ncbi:hypothetical protein FEM48_Zijuj10G0069400 [Ziziphus jujuba var. spinosa]|uniref:non-specific serine/threonine protein kinase n=1 Tax=Ziziphus jujuba var. spinosa TaxID=714518 RepID=A0A978ULZ3_ZIZJJ|nr:hypothetical protein FEM48_Zijuj10G0069400 [Ziziphus jujuba var. spinosa]
MKLIMMIHFSTPTVFFISLFLLLLSSSVSSQLCPRNCGKVPLRFPFGGIPGCGDPRFQHYMNCDQESLTFTTHTGSYPVTSIDYEKQVIYISDPSMSTCSCTQPSKGFGLDWDAPFDFHDDTIFVLLDCSSTSSPIYNPSDISSDNIGNSSKVPSCDTGGVPICNSLYSCRPISTNNLPISTCCVYAPVDLGPAFDMDLETLKCSSYSSFYSFNGRESDPNSWKYGMALRYKFNVKNEFPSPCDYCERSFGVCGYTGAYNSFICNCPSGLNTSTGCLFGGPYNTGSTFLPWQTGAWLVYCLPWLLVWLL